MGQRRHGREAALHVLYQMDTLGHSAESALALYWGALAAAEHDPEHEDETLEAGDEAKDLAEALVRGFADRRADVDEAIRAASHHWRLERMSRVDRNILRLATSELMLQSDIPRRVTLNEAIELAKRYGAEGSPGFVNGILDRIATELGKD